MTAAQLDAVLARILDLARDAGYALRRADPATASFFLVARLADGIETLDAMLFPSAAELADDFFAVCGDRELAVEEALLAADGRSRLLRRLLGREAR